MAEGKRQSASSNAKRMIERLSVTNFKSVRLMEIPCRRVNVFIGEPNTGKTNILEALGMFCFETYPRLARVTRTTQSADLFWDQDLKSHYLPDSSSALHLNPKAYAERLREWAAAMFASGCPRCGKLRHWLSSKIEKR